MNAASQTVDCIIVGAGFAGIGMAMQLRRDGRDSFVILEKAADIGGTWRENTYPGCACDIPSHLYSFSFQPNSEWTRSYASQREIWDYLRSCVEAGGLEKHLRFGEEVVDASFDEGAALWRVRTKRGGSYTARHFVLAPGALHIPAIPPLPGLEQFEGSRFHSASWDHSVGLEGKNVVVVGTGASTIQFVPRIAPLAGHLTVMQRTPPWVLPRPDRPISGFERAMYRHVPLLRKLYRYGLYWLHEYRAVGFVYEPRILKLAERVGRQHIARQIADAELRAKVTPDYRAGCKRILMSNEYYPALSRPNVSVVTEAIREVGRRSVVTRDGREHPADVLIFGTGFQVGELVSRMNITGLGGLRLADAWRDGKQAYRGTNVSGFPNMYVLLGPNTGLGHNSVLVMLEAQLEFVLRQMRALERRNVRFADVDPEAQRRWNESLQPKLQRAVWGTGCQSWYLDEHGRNSTLWPGFTFQFRSQTRRVNLTDLRLTPNTELPETKREEGLP